jgi:hypothetical protein
MNLKTVQASIIKGAERMQPGRRYKMLKLITPSPEQAMPAIEN